MGRIAKVVTVLLICTVCSAADKPVLVQQWGITAEQHDYSISQLAHYEMLVRFSNQSTKGIVAARFIVMCVDDFNEPVDYINLDWSGKLKPGKEKKVRYSLDRVGKLKVAHLTVAKVMFDDGTMWEPAK